jgi:tripartite-type tricarboxylate transporter receptor subunit TctC
MTPNTARRLAVVTLGALCLAGTAAAQESFPSRPIRMLIPTTAGGNMDLLARTVAEKLQAAWGQQVIVESRAGANTMLATQAVAKSPADGYTALFTLSGLVQNLVLQPNPPYKLNDFVPVSMVASFPIVLAASTSLAANDIAEVVKAAKDKPGAMSFGSYGVGSSGHIIGQGLNKLAGIDMTHVPYKGEAASLPDLVSGQIQLAYGSVGFFARQVPTGKVKLVAVASPQRLKDFPTVPTFAEAGYAEVNLAGWGGLFLPAGTPPAVVEKWMQEVRRITAMPDVQKRIFDMGFLPVGNSGAEFTKELTAEIQKWSTVVRANNIKLE